MLKHFLLVISILVSVSVLTAQDTDIPPASFTPETIDGGVLCADETLQFPIGVNIPALDIPPVESLDIMILMDTTGSMGGVIDSVKNNAQQIINGLRTEVADTRFGVATFSAAGESNEFVLHSDFSTDVNVFSAALNPIDASGGGNEIMLRGLWELTQLQWRPDAIKTIVVFTDELYLDPDPGRDRSSSADDLTFASVVDDLQDVGIQVIAVQSGFSGGLATRLQELTDDTNGTYFQLQDAANIPDLIVTGVSGLIARSRFTFAPAGSSGTSLSGADDTWFTQSPENFGYDLSGVNQTVNITIDPAAINASDGVYNLNLDLIRRDDSFGVVSVTFEYYEVCSDFYIPDTVSEEVSTGCTSNVFWESPHIIISYTPDGTANSIYPRINQDNFVFVDVFMTGPRAGIASVEVFAGSVELSSSFPTGWQSLGTISAEMQPDVPMRFGPYTWQAAIDFTSLRAIVSNPSDPTENIADVACENNIAAVQRVGVVLDQPTLGRGDDRIGGLLPLNYSGFAPTLSFDTSSLSGFVEVDGQSVGNSVALANPTGQVEVLIASTDASNVALPVAISDEVDSGLTIYYSADGSLVEYDEAEIVEEATIPWLLIIPGIIFTIVGMLVILLLAVFSGKPNR